MNQDENTQQLHDLAFLVIDSAAKIEHQLDQALAHARGVSFTEFRILLTLSNMHDGRASRVNLAPAVGLTPSAITRALKPLEKLGYVETIKGARDARQSLAVLTSGGKRLLSDAQAVVDDVINALPLELLNGDQMATFAKSMGVGSRII